MEREQIGIPGVDSMMQGGLPKGSIVGLTGPPGIGKSIFSIHYLLQGARKGERCVYINLEEPLSNIENMVRQFDFADEFFMHVKKKNIVLRCYTYSEYEKIYSALLEKVQEDKSINRLVVDSFNIFFASLACRHDEECSPEVAARKAIGGIFTRLRRENLTSLLVLEKANDDGNVFNYNIPFLVDGMINLDFLDFGTIERRIFIPKMRWTSQHKESHAYEIGPFGIRILDE